MCKSSNPVVRMPIPNTNLILYINDPIQAQVFKIFAHASNSVC